jgi:serine/threonine-protein kinase
MAMKRSSDRAMPLIGRTVGGRHLLRSLMGEGGMGAVFQASHLHIGSPAAVKITRPHLLEDSEFLERPFAATMPGRTPRIVD